ncbi:MAG: sigma-54 interaction domain-containing protein [bacterium]
MRPAKIFDQKTGETKSAHALKERLGLRHLVGESPVFIAEIKKIVPIAQCDATVLICGETGTGKELYARAIHYLSGRGSKPFIPMNCGAIPVELVENELFGHERGAYTSAATAQPGVIQECNGGTLFLDEIVCLPLLAQTKLLRFLQEKEYKPLGSAKVCKADLRLIAATNIDGEAAIKEGKLRQDLYYRLNVIPITLPPLRERGGDIPLLARHFLAKYAGKFHKRVEGFSSAAITKLMLYAWPGNIRELEHVVERTVVFAEDKIIGDAEILLPGTAKAGESLQKAKSKVVAQFERTYLQSLLAAHRGNITRAAEAAQKNRRAFWQLIRKYQIDVAAYRTSPANF